MYKHTHKLFSSLFIFLLSIVQVFAQSAEKFLGLPYNSSELSELRNNFTTDKPSESFLSYQKVYKIDYPEDGTYMEFNSDIALYRVALFDSGFSYNAYKNDLPFDVKWGMTLADVEKKTGLLDFTDQNIFIRNFISEDYTINFYFTEGRLHHMKITASLKRLQDKSDVVLKATGIRLLPDGKPQSGNVVDGIGSMMWGNGAVLYKGQWSYGLPHGKGQYIDSFGNKYDGQFKLGFFWGEAKFFSKGYQYSYNGNFVMGKKHEQGKIIYSNKTSYDGEWKQDAMEGTGTYYVGKNYMYKGEMKNNAFNGKGTLQTPQGLITGNFKNGKPHGLCTQETLDGLQSVKGVYKNGKKNGVFTLNLNGEITKVKYEDDIEISNEKIDPALLESN